MGVVVYDHAHSQECQILLEGMFVSQLVIKVKLETLLRADSFLRQIGQMGRKWDYLGDAGRCVLIRSTNRV